MKKKILTILLIVLTGIGIKLMNSKLSNSSSHLNIAYAGHWKTIHPGLQHTLVGDLTLSNQFESLVGFNQNGVYVPLASTSWNISKDYTVFTFKINTAKKFSDGSSLTAADFKKSWETALALDPKSSNNSLLDILYKVEGFNDFEKTKTISGIKAIDKETLEIKFSSSFRMALEYLSGNRFAVYKQKDNKFIGTGAYIISELNVDLLELTPNPYYEDPPKQKKLLHSIKAGDSYELLTSGKIDVIAYLAGAGVTENLTNDEVLSTIVGQDAIHRSLYLNQQKNYTFSNQKHRLAIQYLMHSYLLKDSSLLGPSKFSTIDFQIYLPIQAGRIFENQVLAEIEKGKDFVSDLISQTKTKPIVLIETADFSVKKILADFGLSISEKSRVVDKKEIIDIIYKGTEADIIPGSFGVASGDPDGIYHKLGKNGAIASPMTTNQKISDMLESGRKITDAQKLHDFYQKISIETLKEVPLVHLGFNKAISVYRNDKIKVKDGLLRRNEGHLNIYELK